MRKHSKTIQENIQQVAENLAKVENHPLCFRLYMDDHYFTVVYPDGDLPSDGMRIPKRTTAGGQAFSLDLLYHKLEKVWYETTPYGTDSPDYKIVCEKLEKLMEEWRSK